MRVLVTGGAGFIGSHLVDGLVQHQVDSLLVLDNLRRGNLRNLDLSRSAVEFVNGDVRDFATVQEVTRGIDLVYHLAAQSNVLGAATDMEYSFTTNVTGTFNVLRAACEAGVKRFVFTSSREVYGDPAFVPVPETAPIAPKNAYGASKAAAELYCQIFAAHGFTTRILRLANVYGPRDFDRVIPIFVDNATNGRPLTLYGGKQILDFVWIGRVVDMLMAAGLEDSPGGPLNVGSGYGTRIDELARRVLACTASASTIELATTREIEVTRFVADVSRAAALGWHTDGDPLAHLPELIEASRKDSYAKRPVAKYSTAPGATELPWNGGN
jgi:UDP-glucose 4-epimerase